MRGVTDARACLRTNRTARRTVAVPTAAVLMGVHRAMTVRALDKAIVRSAGRGAAVSVMATVAVTAAVNVATVAAAVAVVMARVAVTVMTSVAAAVTAAVNVATVAATVAAVSVVARIPHVTSDQAAVGLATVVVTMVTAVVTVGRAAGEIVATIAAVAVMEVSVVPVVTVVVVTVAVVTVAVAVVTAATVAAADGWSFPATPTGGRSLWTARTQEARATPPLARGTAVAVHGAAAVLGRSMLAVAGLSPGVSGATVCLEVSPQQQDLRAPYRPTTATALMAMMSGVPPRGPLGGTAAVGLIEVTERTACGQHGPLAISSRVTHTVTHEITGVTLFVMHRVMRHAVTALVTAMLKEAMHEDLSRTSDRAASMTMTINLCIQNDYLLDENLF